MDIHLGFLDGFYFGAGLFGSLLVFIVLVLVITLVASFFAYLADKASKGGKDNGSNSRR